MRLATAIFAFAATVALTATTASASDFMFSPYIGLEASNLHVNHETVTSPVSGDPVNFDDVYPTEYRVLTPFIGIDLHKYLAVEAGYMHTNEKTKNFTPVDFVEMEFQGPYADLVGKFPLSGNVDILGSVGIAQLRASGEFDLPTVGASIRIKDKDTAIRFGLGADLRLHRHWSLRGTLRYTDIDFGGAMKNMMQYGIAAVYRF